MESIDNPSIILNHEDHENYGKIEPEQLSQVICFGLDDQISAHDKGRYFLHNPLCPDGLQGSLSLPSTGYRRLFFLGVRRSEWTQPIFVMWHLGI
jgi:hypothetical protein